MPKRIQRKRTKGWRMPEGAVYVGRPTKFGNPFRLEDYDSAQACVDQFRHWLMPPGERIDLRALRILSYLDELRGKDLACWCALDQPCHADVLLEVLERW